MVNHYKRRGYEILNISKAGGLGGTTIKWTKEKIIKDAKKYKYRSEWHKKSRGAYAAARQFKILDEVTKHMQAKPRS